MASFPVQKSVSFIRSHLFVHFFKIHDSFSKYLCIFWLCWVFAAACGLSLIAEWRLLSSCSAWASHCGGFSRCGQALGVQASVLQHASSVVVVLGLSCLKECGIFLDYGSNLCPLHWQADSLPLNHQGSPS